MSNLFSMPDMPPPPTPPPPPPTKDDAADAQAARDVMRKRKGRAATVLTSPTGINSENTGASTLLGG